MSSNHKMRYITKEMKEFDPPAVFETTICDITRRQQHLKRIKKKKSLFRRHHNQIMKLLYHQLLSFLSKGKNTQMQYDKAIQGWCTNFR